MKTKKHRTRQAVEVVGLFILALVVFAVCQTKCSAENDRGAAPAVEISAAPKITPAAIAAPAPVETAEPEAAPEQITDGADAAAEDGAAQETAPAPVAEIVTLYDVPLSVELQLFIIDLCEQKHIDPAIVLAMAEIESGYQAGIMGDNGHAYGLLQVQARWHRERMERLGCYDLLDPFQNVTVAVDYLAYCIEYNGGNVEMGLVAYNAGQAGAEAGWFNHGVYSSDYSRKVLTTSQYLTEGALSDVQ